jgi:DNA-binding response OmpR family regulator
MKYLAVDSNIELANSEAAVWAERGISMDRVDNMTEGIEKLMYRDYLYVGINSDAVDFMPLLSTMRGVTNTPILIVTSNFTTETEVAALENGADLYARWHENAEGNVASVLAHISRIAKRDTPPCKVMVHRNLLLAPSQRSVFVGNERIDLTRLEFDVLLFLMANHGIVLGYGQIYSAVWNEEYDEAANEVVRGAVKRLRAKISDDAIGNSLIETVWGVGYKFPASIEQYP